jgi:hypothetical protein
MADLTVAQEADTVVDAIALLLVAIVHGRPFDRRNGAVGVAAVDLLARLNGQALHLEPPAEVTAMIGRIRDGQADSEVRGWLVGRVAARARVVRPRCPACSMPLREGLAADTVLADRFALAVCGGCGHLLGQRFHNHRLQEV